MLKTYGIWLRAVREADGEIYWIAEVPQLPGCISDGETADEAVTNAIQAADEWVEEARRLGRDVPEPLDDIKVQVA